MRLIGAKIGVLILCAGAHIVKADEAGEAAQVYRRAVFQSMLWNFAPMGEMARGKRDFDAAETKRRALAVSYLSLLLDEAFPAGSGASAGTTDALDAIWQNPTDFSAKLNKLQAEANALRKIAALGDQASFVEQFKKVGAACKACHDKYKAD